MLVHVLRAENARSYFVCRKKDMMMMMMMMMVMVTTTINYVATVFSQRLEKRELKEISWIRTNQLK